MLLYSRFIYIELNSTLIIDTVYFITVYFPYGLFPYGVFHYGLFPYGLFPYGLIIKNDIQGVSRCRKKNWSGSSSNAATS